MARRSCARGTRASSAARGAPAGCWSWFRSPRPSARCATACARAVWIAPAHLEEEVRALVAELGVAERVELFAAQALGGDPAHWWDLERIAAEYARYAAASAPALDGDRTPARAFADYMRHLDDWRPIPFHDPGLPAESLPADRR